MIHLAQRPATPTVPHREAGKRTGRPRHPLVRSIGWGTTFLAFPIAGFAAMSIVGAIDDPGSAALGGAIAGAVIGSGQAFGSRVLDRQRALDPRTWIPASAVGMGVGLLAASGAVGFDTHLGSLALMGAITGVPLGLAQALALPHALAPRRVARLAWGVAMPVVLAVGWSITTLIGVDVERRYAIFGGAGAVVATALTGLLLAGLARWSRSSAAPEKAAAVARAVA